MDCRKGIGAMHIAIDARRICDEHAGMGVYTYNLIKHLQKIDKKNIYTIILNPLKTKIVETSNGNFRKYVTPISIENHIVGDLWRNIYLPHQLHKDKVDVFHDPGYFLPIINGGYKSVVTVHDLVVFSFPQTNSKKYFWYMKQMTSIGAKNADMIIADSYHTKEDLIKILNIPKEKIRVVYLATSKHLQPTKDPEKHEWIKKKYHINGKYILCVSTIEPRKNLPRLLSAYHQLRKETKLEHKLVVCGTFGWLFGDIFTTIDRLNLRDDVIFTGYIDDEELPHLYSAAELFVFPSLYEGFGLPALEAMACGVPVITSNSSSLPEIVGDAGIMINPYKSEELSEAISKVLCDENLRKKMSEKSIIRANKFSWEQTALQTLEIYEDLYINSHPFFGFNHTLDRQQKKLKVSIVIVNWNVKEYLTDCLDSIKLHLKDYPHEVIVVDNNSQDGSVDEISINYPDVKLIVNKTNEGFAKANNKALKECSAEYIVLLNPDCIIKSNTIQIMVEFMEKNQRCAILGPKLVNENNTLQPSCRNFLANWHLALSHLVFKFLPAKYRGRFIYEFSNHDTIREVDWMVGACLATRRKALEDVGGLDEDFFMFHEDTDWCYRFKKKGWKVIFNPEAVVIHFGNKSSQKKWGDTFILKYLESKHIFIKKHYGIPSLIIHRFFYSILLFLRFFSTFIKYFLSKKTYPVDNTKTKKLIQFYKDALILEFFGKKAFYKKSHFSN
jgi:GT2 family glycosyltransferase/glycosyltransferase involved in cell wall biosynthesis